MQQTAWAGVAKKNSAFQLRYQKLRPRRGPQRAITAVAHAQLIAIYWTLRNGTPYQEQIRQSEEERRNAQIHHHLRQLSKLGHEIQTEVRRSEIEEVISPIDDFRDKIRRSSPLRQRHSVEIM
jgi:hypothetical protein